MGFISPIAVAEDTRLHSQHERWADALLRETQAHDGLAPVDLERFWADQAEATRDPFSAVCPQLPLGVMMSWECVFDELGVPEDHWRFLNDHAWALQLKKAYNDKAAHIVGRRLLDETPHDPTRCHPPRKQLHDVFEAKMTWESGSWWLHQSARTEDELRALLDRVDARDLRTFILPPNWAEECARLRALGVAPPLYRGQRGPVTFAMSIFGVENLIFLILDNPALAARLRDTILRVMLEIGRILDEAAGYTSATAPHGFYFADDNCALLNAEMYEFFGWPILQGIFARYSPDAGDMRGQHSDSAMGHLLPLLGRLGMTTVNLGPTLTVGEIRAHLPRAVICGQLAPFTFSRNEERAMLRELFRDCSMAHGSRGVVFSTAGSINNGSRLTGMRLLMAGIQRHCRFVA
jgi:uroporphyrinogen decarboxylase